MKLISARVCRYKSITDSESVQIANPVTCLVGKNESGKTAFLEALYRLNPLSSGLRKEFQELYDYPRRRLALDRKGIPTIQPVMAEFELEQDDVDALEAALGPGILKSQTISVSKNYENIRSWTITLDEQAAAKHLAKGTGLNQAVIRGKMLYQSVPGQLRGRER